MREFASASARAATLPRAAKALYTAFCAFVGLGIASCAGLYDGIVAFATRATPGELYARLIAHYQTGIATRALLEVTHAHLFVVPILLLVLGHLFLLTGLPAQTKMGWIGGGRVLRAPSSRSAGHSRLGRRARLGVPDHWSGDVGNDRGAHGRSAVRDVGRSRESGEPAARGDDPGALTDTL